MECMRRRFIIWTSIGSRIEHRTIFDVGSGIGLRMGSMMQSGIGSAIGSLKGFITGYEFLMIYCENCDRI